MLPSALDLSEYEMCFRGIEVCKGEDYKRDGYADQETVRINIRSRLAHVEKLLKASAMCTIRQRCGFLAKFSSLRRLLLHAGRACACILSSGADECVPFL